MSNLTPLFNKYVEVINESLDKSVNDGLTSNESSRNAMQLKLDDSFIKECCDLLKVSSELRKVLRVVEQEYRNESGMSENEKDDIDTELRLQLQKYVQKFKHLQDYEQKRQKLIEDEVLSSKNNMVYFLQGKNSDKVTLFHRSNNEFRSGILQSLNMWLNSVSNKLTSMQQERLDSQRKFDEPIFNSIPSELEIDSPVSVSVTQSQPLETTKDEVKHYEETISKLTQEQIQLLETEHEELLNHKNDQLKKVENINKTILEIATIQNELASHLQEQSQNINNILDNQDTIEVNIQEGNKQLTKAKRAAGRTAKMTTYMAILLGLFILLLDYVG
ncbi:hypothetical protein Kpol_1018p81 [Vanderwaltozyma polyspora DSM 70294]|uniref:t-SNARE coiled-coil homology domain-containing protein n=1 Tax=Vanderwaltozyma polyspora (strain ATCC 22028 / DSM 70294 / BCRC 21397 / CBS 2163 / NBRC 10782 / NRRL Y-8283 / UCD 57-17) TaxID=436907 RepID=A7TDS9_VANPO|nr:uncharacterized protein Kpol_1018p81 [Vanderwaltozyma polyspora DSM 70294]EDO19549.1 hypothetical protein Kpol_1018p81 [Vanderwaltozyma polyspora DSM 70294]